MKRRPLLRHCSLAARSVRMPTDTNMLKQPRGDDALHADTAVCDAAFRAPQNGTVTSRSYERCMRARRRHHRICSHFWLITMKTPGGAKPPGEDPSLGEKL